MIGQPEIDPALVRAAQRGDRIAVADVMDALAPYVGRVCGPIALQDGPDAAQEALIAIFKNLGDLREPGAIYGWARAIAVREAVRVARRAARAVPAELADVPAPGDPQLAADVRDVLARLTPEHRAVLVLRDLEGLDVQAAGALLNVPAATVRTRLFRPGAASGRRGCDEPGLARGRPRPGPADAGHRRDNPRCRLRRKADPRAV